MTTVSPQGTNGDRQDEKGDHSSLSHPCIKPLPEEKALVVPVEDHVDGTIFRIRLDDSSSFLRKRYFSPSSSLYTELLSQSVCPLLLPGFAPVYEVFIDGVKSLLFPWFERVPRSELFPLSDEQLASSLFVQVRALHSLGVNHMCINETTVILSNIGLVLCGFQNISKHKSRIVAKKNTVDGASGNISVDQLCGSQLHSFAVPAIDLYDAKWFLISGLGIDEGLISQCLTAEERVAVARLEKKAHQRITSSAFKMTKNNKKKPQQTRPVPKTCPSPPIKGESRSERGGESVVPLGISIDPSVSPCRSVLTHTPSCTPSALRDVAKVNGPSAPPPPPRRFAGKTKVDLDKQNLTCIPPWLVGMIGVKKLYLTDNRDLRDIKPLSNMSLTSLQVLDLNLTSVMDLSPLRGAHLSSLKLLDLSFALVADLSPLLDAGLSDSLETLALSNTCVSIRHLGALDALHLPSLRELDLFNTPASAHNNLPQWLKEWVPCGCKVWWRRPSYDTPDFIGE